MKNHKNHWKTISIFKTTTGRTAAALNQKGPYLQAKFGRLSFEQSVDQEAVEGVGSPFIPLPPSADDLDGWAKEMHDMIDALVAQAKVFEQNKAGRSEAKALRPRRGRPGLRALARQDAKKIGVSEEFNEKDAERKKKPKRSKQEKAARSREVRDSMKKS